MTGDVLCGRRDASCQTRREGCMSSLVLVSFSLHPVDPDRPLGRRPRCRPLDLGAFEAQTLTRGLAPRPGVGLGGVVEAGECGEKVCMCFCFCCCRCCILCSRLAKLFLAG